MRRVCKARNSSPLLREVAGPEASVLKASALAGNSLLSRVPLGYTALRPLPHCGQNHSERMNTLFLAVI
jgi:hypothetical protein